MRTILVLLAFLAATCVTNELKAQFSLGGGIAYGTEIKELGIQARGIYTINEQWRGGADFVYWLVGDGVTSWELNANGHYVFTEDDFLAYGLAGLNLASVSVDLGPFGSASETEIGLNLGVGGQLKFSDAISGIAEIKYTIGGYDQLGLSAGVLFSLGN